MKFSSLMTTAAAVLFLAGCMGGPSASGGIAQGATQKSGFMGLKTNGAVEAVTPAAFKGAEKVVIGNFVVGFATYTTDSAKAGGGLLGNGFGGKSTAKSTLTGIDAATMQAITDAAYADFVRQLQAQGYTVAPRDGLLADARFAKSTQMDSPFNDSTGGIFGGGSKTTYVAPRALGSIRPFMGDIPGTMGGMGFSNPTVAASEYASKSGEKILSVVYLLDFSNAESYGGWHRQSSAVQVGQGLTVVPGTSKVSLIGGQSGTFSSANGSIAIGQPITSQTAFADISDATSDAAKATEIATNVIGVLGGIGSNSSRQFTFAARPGDYTAAAHDVTGQATRLLVGQMAALR